LQLHEGKNMDVAIIGAGPAGLSAALYAGRAKLSTVVAEQGVSGGQAATTHWIENYPGFPEGISGPDLMQRMEQQARKFDVEFIHAAVNSVSRDSRGCFSVTSGEGEFTAGTVIVATGTAPQSLGVPGEDKLRGIGVSYCATCDGPFFREKEVLVIGGGDSAIVEALFLTRFASKVTVIHRRGELRATKVLQDDAFSNSKIEFCWHSVVSEILGDSKVEGVTLRDVRTGDTRFMEAGGVFTLISNFLSLITGTESKSFEMVKIFLAGSLEITYGLFLLSNAANVPVTLKVLLAAMFCGFGGFSVHTQVTGLCPFDFKLKSYYFGKIMHGVLAAAFTGLILINQSIPVMKSGLSLYSINYSGALLIVYALLLILIISYIISTRLG